MAAKPISDLKPDKPEKPKPPPTLGVCSDCLYGVLCANGKIECHFAPPTILSAPGGARGAQGWPNMNQDDFCGQFRKRDGDDDD